MPAFVHRGNHTSDGRRLAIGDRLPRGPVLDDGPFAAEDGTVQTPHRLEPVKDALEFLPSKASAVNAASEGGSGWAASTSGNRWQTRSGNEPSKGIPPRSGTNDFANRCVKIEVVATKDV